MNIRDFEYLVALAEHKHFRKAAEACFVSQPTLSGQIRKLEDEIGLQLTERSPRKVIFTESGLQLVEQAKSILNEVKTFKDMASGHGEAMTGPMHIGFIPTVGPYILPKIIPHLKESFPILSFTCMKRRPINWSASWKMASSIAWYWLRLMKRRCSKRLMFMMSR